MIHEVQLLSGWHLMLCGSQTLCGVKIDVSSMFAVRKGSEELCSICQMVNYMITQFPFSYI